MLERESASEVLALQSSVDEPYEDAVLVDGLFSGCIESSGTCWNTWTVTLTHTGGPATEVHWAFDSFANGASGAIAHQVLEF